MTTDPTLAPDYATIAARAILEAALKRGIHVGTDGSELILVAPLRVPRNVWHWFEHWIDQFRDEVLAIITSEQAEQTKEIVQH